MQAAHLYETNAPLEVEQVPDPQLRAGGAIVKILSTHIPAFSGEVLAGRLGYAFPEPFPFVPGTNAVGVLEAVADDVFGLQIGQRVFCDPFIASRTIGTEPDGILIAWTGLGPAANRMQSLWRDGTFAERVLWPAECLTPLVGAEEYPPERLAALSYLSIAYGGLLQGGFRPSQSLVVNGATGGLGTAAVIVALAMGASKIVAVGRDSASLKELQQLDSHRIVTVQLSGNPPKYTEQIAAASNGADMTIDMLGAATTPEPTLACIKALRPKGTAVFMGGVRADIPLPYVHIMLNELSIKGAFMYPRDAPGDLLRMILAETLQVSALRPRVFPLSAINEAVAEAGKLRGLDYCVVNPQ